MKIIWSPLALERVVEIGEFIARDHPNAAADWVEGIFAVVERLESFPESGRHVPESSRSEIREVLYAGYRVIYRIDVECIVVLTVRHSRQVLWPDDAELE